MVKAAVANTLWLAASAPAWLRFTAALDDPAQAQEAIFRRYLRRGADTAFGREHGLTETMTYGQFVNHVPVRGYDELQPWIERIVRGEKKVLSSAPVRRLVPTSGSTAARKLIPYTDESHREFQRAVSPWIFELYERTPRSIAGPSYWSVTPQAQADPDKQESAVPIGFDSDSEYLGGWFRRIVDAALAVPGKLNKITSIEVLRYVTLLLLLRRRDLSLISVWHPSFLELLLRGLPENLQTLIKDVADGGCAVLPQVSKSLHGILQARPDPERAREIKRVGGENVVRLWPNLSVVSCWADGHAELAAAALSTALPGVTIQPKGLLATEGVVSIPLAGDHPLAIRSHFFEFIDSSGRTVLAPDLEVGKTYSVLLTTAGGLWRYRLDDLIRVTGRCDRTPSIRFIGKAGLTSDRMGEKLSEGFVSSVLAQLFANHRQPTFSLLAPELTPEGYRYTLYMNSPPPPSLAVSLDELLCNNPQYAHCRKLGQLRSPSVFFVTADAYSTYCDRLVQNGQRLGDIKPVSLSTLDAWRNYFTRGCAASQEQSFEAGIARCP